MNTLPFSFEQKDILSTVLSKQTIMTIKALAGTGKTTTVLNLASLNKQLTFLYIARNNSIVNDVQKEIKIHKILNTQANTLHSYAFRWIITQRKNVEIKKALDVETILKVLSVNFGIVKTKNAQYVKMALSDFCSQVENIENWMISQKENYEIKFGKKSADLIFKMFNFFWEQMDTGKTTFITHDYYLKKFIDAEIPIKENYLIIDESQDLDEIMYKFVVTQIKKGKGIMSVGDYNQSIYGFLKSKDIIFELNKDPKTIQKCLTRSFRFAPNSKMEKMANAFLSIKKETIYGAANHETDVIKTIGFIARTNLQILQKTIDLIKENKTFNLIGGTTGFNLNLIYDIWNLSSEKSANKIKSDFIKGFKSKRDLQKWADEHNDTEHLTACNIVDALKKWSQDDELREALNIYPGDKKSFISMLFKSIEMRSNPKSNTILSTYHKSKGLSIDKVVILNSDNKENENPIPECFYSTRDPIEFDGIVYDFIKIDKDKSIFDEYNLLYVAVTRAKKEMSILDKKIIVSANFVKCIAEDKEDNISMFIYDKIHYFKIPFKGLDFSYFAIAEDELKKFKTEVKERI